MAALETVARAHYQSQALLSTRAADALLILWALLDPASLVASWNALSLAERMFVTLATFQVAAANSAPPYVAAALASQGARSTPRGVLVAQSVAGVGSDGRALESLMVQPLIATLTAIRDGIDVDDALQLGASSLATIAETQVADAGRAAEQVVMTTEPEVTGYVRMLVPPACGRCAVLAGRFYRWSAGFARHPRCDCRHIPAVEDQADDLRTDPDAYFRSLSPTAQDRYFGVAAAQALRDGADMSRVVNATGRASGVYTADGRTFTTDATTRRGVGRRGRLTPDAIYKQAGTDRDEAIRLLALHGYITT